MTLRRPTLAHVLFAVSAFCILGSVLGHLLSHDPYWPSQRLSGPLAWLFGVPLYDTLGGPRTGWAYFPLGALVLSWTAIFTRPSSAFLAASATSLLISTLPVLVYFLNQPKGPGSTAKQRAVPVLLFLCITLHLAPMGSSVFGVHVDGLALGLAGMAAVLLTLTVEGHLTPRPRLDAIIAALAVGALWTKQNMIFVPLGVVLASFWIRGPRASRALLLWTAVWGVLSLGLMAWAFPLKDLWLNCITLISQFPWINGFDSEGSVANPSFPTKVKLFSVSALRLYRMIPWLTLGILAYFWAERSGRGPKHPALRIFLVLALVVGPFSVLGPTKLGGGVNGYTPLLYFLTLFLLATTFQWERAVGGGAPRPALSFSEVVLVAFMPLALFVGLSSWRQWYGSGEHPDDIAFRYIRQNPGTTFFVANPTAQLLAERRLYWVHYAVMDREWAQWEVSPQWLKGLVPPSVREVVLPAQGAGSALPQTLSEFSRREDKGELPGFAVYRRQNSTPTDPRPERQLGSQP